MEDQRFDDLARTLAKPVSRRQVLKVLVGATVGGLFVRSASGLALAKTPNCASYCDQVFGVDTAATTQCIQDAKNGTGACYNCGPASPNGTQPICCQTTSSGSCATYTTTPCCSGSQTCCGGACANTSTDTSNCGTCGTVCPTPANSSVTCSGGACGISCNGGFTYCRGNCVNLSTDPSNCGTCGTVCPTPANGSATCSGGACGITCNAGLTNCNGNCVNTSTDPNNCGFCGNACGSTQICQNGTCGAPPCALVGQLCTTDSDCCNGVPCNTATGPCTPGATGCTCHYLIP